MHGRGGANLDRGQSDSDRVDHCSEVRDKLVPVTQPVIKARLEFTKLCRWRGRESYTIHLSCFCLSPNTVI